MKGKGEGSTGRRGRRVVGRADDLFELLANSAQDVVFRLRLGPTPQFDYVSPSVLAVSGYSQEEFYADAGVAFTGRHPEDLAAEEAACRSPEGLPLSYVHRFTRKDGAVIWTEQRNTLVRDDEGHVVAIAGIARDVTQQKQTEERLRESERQLAEAQELAHVGSWSWDVRADVVTWSDELFRIYGLEPESRRIAYETFLRLVHPDDREMVDGAVMGASRSGAPFAFDYRVTRPDGTERWLHGRGQVVMEGGETVRMFGTAQDITERKRAEEMKNGFIAAASHELRTPVGAMAGAAETLAIRRHELSPEEFGDFLDILQRQARYVRELVRHLLDLSQLEQGEVTLLVEPVAIVEIVDRVLASCPPPSGKTVATRISDVATVQADRVLLETILRNLLTNAYHHGGGEVRLEAARVGDSVELSVDDDGPGVPADVVPRVFEPFARGPNARGIEGAGLGLAIVRRSVELLGGRVAYEPASPRGARFLVRLPLPTP